MTNLELQTPKGPAVPARGVDDGIMAVAQVRLDGEVDGNRFYLGNNAAVTGIIPVTTVPTTLASHCLWNPSDKHYFFEEIGVFLEAGTTDEGGIVLMTLFRNPVQLGTGVAGQGIQAADGSGASSDMVLKDSITITDPAAPVWYPLGESESTAAAFPITQTGLVHRGLRGRIVVPPNTGLGIQVVEGTGTASKYCPIAMWVERKVG